MFPQGHLDARRAPAHPQVEKHDHAVPGVNHLALDLEGFPGGKPLSPEPTHGLNSPVDPTDVGPFKRGDILLHFRVPKFGHLGDRRPPVETFLAGTNELVE